MNPANFEGLVSACQRVHELAHQQATKAVNQLLVVRNLFLGSYIVEFEQGGRDRAQYGESLLQDLSGKLTTTLGRGFSVDNLELMRRFYQTYGRILLSHKSETASRISSTGDSEALSRVPEDHEKRVGEISAWSLQDLTSHFPLSWSHYVCLLGVSASEERSFYEIEATRNQWSLRELRRQMNSGLYERLALSRDQDGVRKLAQEGQIIESPADLIKDPYILEFLGLDESSRYSESDLETAIITKLETFLLELGKGFLFEARQKRFTFEEDHFFVDLVFYNRLLRCYALIDLKIGELTHQDLGQMQMYVNYFDRHVKTEEERPTVGIVLCKRKKDALVEITLPQDSNIHASEYQLYLPSKEELKEQMNQVSRQLEGGKP
jgi:predicted nuclease of restriction endonuclease-like (RecB) superfamily